MQTHLAQKLVVIVGGLFHKKPNIDNLESAVREAFRGENIHVLIARTEFRTPGRSLLNRTAAIMIQITEEWQKGCYDKVVLVGYSIGAVVVRKAWMAGKWAELKKSGLLEGNPEPAEFVEKELEDIAHGGTAEERKAGSVSMQQGASAWAGKVERMVLLGSMDLGWHLSHHFGFGAIIVGWVARQLVRPFTPWISWPILDCEKGTSFIENLRIQWARLLHEMDSNQQTGPLFIQMFGTRDRFVGPMEGVDPLFLSPPHHKAPSATDADGPKGRYVCIEVPETDHQHLPQMADEATLRMARVAPEERARAGRRRELMIKALRNDRDALKPDQAYLAEDAQLSSPNPDVTDVIFVIHGIRDAGYWTQHLAQRIKALSSPQKDIRFVSETSSYGYFAMLPFVSSGTRRDKIQWLFNEYTDNAVRYPRAKFHFVGHSNGTYLLAAAMERSACIRFVNVAFAGSVVRRDYPWRRLLKKGQVSRVANYLATTDWVVAVFPWFIGLLQVIKDWLLGSLFSLPPRRDLGSAGDQGFKDFDLHKQELVNVPPVRGGHGAAIEERNWPYLADFILGQAPAACEKKTRSTVALIACRLFFAGVAVLLAWGIWAAWPWMNGLPTWQHGVGYVAGILLLRRILTRL